MRYASVIENAGSNYSAYVPAHSQLSHYRP
jgi:hypothetical protein